jgi:hypothetical protein
LLLLDAFAGGYAEAGIFPVPDWVRTVATVALGTDGATPRLVEDAGRVEGRRAALLRRRTRIYAQHCTIVMELAAQLAAHAPMVDLAHACATETAKFTETNPSKQRRDAVKAAAAAILARTVLTTEGLSTAWRTANADGYTEAHAEGHAEAAAAPKTGGPADPARVAAVFEAATAGLAGTAAWQATSNWGTEQLDGLAGDIADTTGTITDPTALLDPISKALRNADGVAYYLEEQLHAGYATGFAVIAAQQQANVNFVTAGDNRVESLCLSYAAASPWTPEDVPQPPVHGLCRCWLEAADPADALNGVLAAV